MQNHPLIMDGSSSPVSMPSVPPLSELERRMANFRGLLSERKRDAALIVDEKNVRYLSGFTGNDSALLIAGGERFILTDFRYVEEAKESAKGWTIVVEPHGMMEKAGRVARQCRVKELAIEPGAMRLCDLAPLRHAAGKIKLKREHCMVAELRVFKSAWEVACIEAALRIQEQCFLEFCAAMKCGISERDAAAKLRYMLVLAGADDQAFEPFFQFDSNSCLPHGRATSRTLKSDSAVLVDWGAKVAGYHSDLTRMFFWGKIPPLLRKVHALVREAQRHAIERIAPGVELSAIDDAAHAVINKAGYKENFEHATGHGIGLDLHEHPTLSERAKGCACEGMVLTVEPGVYLPGVAGIRVEDIVLVTKTGCRVLSKLKSGLRWDRE